MGAGPEPERRRPLDTDWAMVQIAEIFDLSAADFVPIRDQANLQPWSEKVRALVEWVRSGGDETPISAAEWDRIFHQDDPLTDIETEALLARYAYEQKGFGESLGELISAILAAAKVRRIPPVAPRAPRPRVQR